MTNLAIRKDTGRAADQQADARGVRKATTCGINVECVPLPMQELRCHVTIGDRERDRGISGKDR